METAILDKWFARALEAYPADGARFAASDNDPFRNAARFALRENLAVLLREIRRGMDEECVREALHGIIPLRAVQNLTVSQALDFLFAARTILAGTPGLDPEVLNSRVDRLGLLGFEEYLRCRERVAEVGRKERVRSMAVPAAIKRGRV